MNLDFVTVQGVMVWFEDTMGLRVKSILINYENTTNRFKKRIRTDTKYTYTTKNKR